MGLLDEAIRDHLELKRRRGADPSEIAMAEHEALEPVFPPEELHGEPVPNPSEDTAVSETVRAAQPEAPAPDPAPTPAGGETASAPAPAADVDMSIVAQDTAEVDMQAVLDEEPEAAVGGSPEGPIEDELLEWEMPSQAAAGTPAANSDQRSPAPGDEFAPQAAALDGDVPVEIPGQERLTFE